MGRDGPLGPSGLASVHYSPPGKEHAKQGDSSETGLGYTVLYSNRTAKLSELGHFRKGSDSVDLSKE